MRGTGHTNSTIGILSEQGKVMKTKPGIKNIRWSLVAFTVVALFAIGTPSVQARDRGVNSPAQPEIEAWT